MDLDSAWQYKRGDTGVYHTFYRLELSYAPSAWTGRPLLSAVTVPRGERVRTRRSGRQRHRFGKRGWEE